VTSCLRRAVQTRMGVLGPAQLFGTRSQVVMHGFWPILPVYLALYSRSRDRNLSPRNMRSIIQQALVSQQSVERVNFWKIHHEFYLDCTADMDLVFGVKGDRSGYNHRTVWYLLWGRSLFFTHASISVESSQCLVFGVRGDRSWCAIGRSLPVQSSQCLVFGVRGDRKYKLFALFISTPVELDKHPKPHHDQISSSDLLNALQFLSRRCSIEKQESLYTLPPVLKQYIKGL